MDYVKELLTAINNYTETDMQSKERLRDFICVISDNTDLIKDELMKELLYIASRKMRMFGYNVQNNLTSDPLKQKAGGITIKLLAEFSCWIVCKIKSSIHRKINLTL